MKLYMVSLGCDKNLVDSEEMLGESIEEILGLADLKETGNLKVLVVTGCMAQRYKEEILREIPEVDAIVGTTGRAGIAQAVDDAFAGKKSILLEDASRDEVIKAKRMVSTGGHYAYLKIAEGCDKNCTYCIIPKIRGHYRSVPKEKLIAEAKSLARDGVTELILVAQETTLYGLDLYGQKSLHLLLRELCQIEELHWIRILYCYPEEIYPELIETIRAEKKICRYLDLPIQHASDRVLKRMNRRTTEADISGFPGETEEDHERLKEFVSEMKFDRLGVFAYSQEEDTPAARMKEQIPEEVKEARRGELMEIQQEISLARGKARIGTRMEAVIEGELPEEGIYEGRTYGDAPGVDGYVFIPKTEELMSGDFVTVRITGASHYDLTGEIENEFTE